jgi:hypothetical protein
MLIEAPRLPAARLRTADAMASDFRANDRSTRRFPSPISTQRRRDAFVCSVSLLSLAIGTSTERVY